MEEHNQSPHNKKFIDSLAPKSAFKVGLVSGLGVMFALGFFVMIGIFINQAIKTDANTQPINNASNNAAANPSEEVANNIAGVEVDKDDWLRGDKKAKITIVEFSDIDCPYCQKFHDTMNQVIKNYGKDVNWVFRQFPLAQLHPEATKKAEYAECVGAEAGNDKFWAFLDYMFANKTPLASIDTALNSIGVNAGKVNACVTEGKFAQKVQDQIAQAVDAGGRGTPYSVIVAGDQRLPINGALPYDTVAQQLDALLK